MRLGGGNSLLQLTLRRLLADLLLNDHPIGLLLLQLLASSRRVHTACGAGELVWHLWGQTSPQGPPLVLPWHPSHHRSVRCSTWQPRPSSSVPSSHLGRQASAGTTSHTT